MTPSAIHQAIRLSKYPKEMAWMCQASVDLPHGMTELLRLCASSEKLEVFAKKNHTDATPLHEMLLNFISKVLLNKSNSNKRILGVKDLSDLEQLKLHYQLLIKIFHPDKNSSPDAVNQTSRITKAYQSIKDEQNNVADEYKNIRISRVPPKSFYQATVKAEQEISSIKSISLALLAVTLISAVWIGGYLYEPNNSELFSRNTEVGPKIQHADISALKQDSAAVNQLSKASLSNANNDQQQFQVMLSDIESAYEKGNATKIQNILNSPEIKQQTNQEVFAKLEDLFEITSDRKMLLYNFEWKNISGQISGKGKFLSRYLLKGEDQWLTREGVASLLAKQADGKIDIQSLKLENTVIDH